MRSSMATLSQADLDVEAFWARVDKSGGEDACWPWTGRLNAAGYGDCYAPGVGRGMPAHRLAYELLRGVIPHGLVLDHVCHNESECDGAGGCSHRACCNPAHLEPVTNAVNIRRGKSVAAINAKKTHCPKGHPFTEENIERRPEGRGCKTCRRERAKEKYHRLKRENAAKDDARNEAIK